MRRFILSGVLLGSMSLYTAAAAFADQPGPNWISRAKVQQILRKAGYGQIISMEADDGHWEGVTTKNGRRIEFHVDPHSGQITKAEPDDSDHSDHSQHSDR